MTSSMLAVQIEGLRSEMIKVAERQGSLVDPQVVEISQRLDRLILLMQQNKMFTSSRLHKRPN